MSKSRGVGARVPVPSSFYFDARDGMDNATLIAKYNLNRNQLVAAKRWYRLPTVVHPNYALRQDLVTMRKCGLSLEDLADKFGLTPTEVRMHLVTAGREGIA